MKPIENYFFVVGGVLLPRLTYLACELLEEINGVSLNSSTRIELDVAEQALLLGQKSSTDYLDGLAARTQGKCSSASLLELFVKRSRLDTGALAVAEDLSHHKAIYLICDYPRGWFEKICQCLPQLGQLIPRRVFYTSELQAADGVQSLLDRLQMQSALRAGHSLWVDAYPFRTSAAIRRGIDAIIYVEERRLRRELALRRLL